MKFSTLKQRIIGQCLAGPYPNVARSWQALYDDQRKTNNPYFSLPLPNNQIRYEDRTRGGVTGCSVLDKSVSLNVKDLQKCSL